MGENGGDRNDRDRKLGDVTVVRGTNFNQLNQGLIIVITQLIISY